MTYAMSLSNVGFADLTHDEMLCVDGGSTVSSKTLNQAAAGFAVAAAGCVLAAAIAPVAAPVCLITAASYGLGSAICWWLSSK